MHMQFTGLDKETAIDLNVQFQNSILKKIKFLIILEQVKKSSKLWRSEQQ